MNIPPKKKRRVPTKKSHCLRSELAGAKVEQGCLAAAAQLQGKLFFSVRNASAPKLCTRDRADKTFLRDSFFAVSLS